MLLLISMIVKFLSNQISYKCNFYSPADSYFREILGERKTGDQTYRNHH